MDKIKKASSAVKNVDSISKAREALQKRARAYDDRGDPTFRLDPVSTQGISPDSGVTRQSLRTSKK